MDELVNSVWFTFFAGLASIIGLFIPLYQTRIRYLSSSILKNREMLKIFLISIGFGLIIISLIEINKQEYPPSRTYKTIYRLLHTSQTSPAWQEGVYTFSIPQIKYIKKMNVEIDSFIISNRCTEIFYRAEVTNERKQGYLIKHSNISKNNTNISEFSKRKRAAELGLSERTPKRITIEVVDPFEPNYTYLLEDPFATPILGSYHLIDKDTILLDNYLFLGKLKFPSIKGIKNSIKCWPNKISDNQSEYFLFENENQEKYENKIWGLMVTIQLNH